MALGGLLSLKWNNHCSTFLHILSNLHKKNSYDDATVACDGKLYPVHKLVLSTCSDYFQEMFEKTHGKHPVIVLKDIKSEVFEALLKYMYIGEVNVIQEKLSELINAAECLKIKGLAAPDEEPEQSSHSSRSGHSSSGKRKQDQYSSDSSAPPTKLHRSSSHSNAESTKNTSHAISNSSSNSSDLNKNRSNANYNHSTSKSSYQDKSIASSNNNVDSSRRRRSDSSSHRSGSLSKENLSSVQDDDIEEIPASVVKQEPVDLGDEPVEEVGARGREGAEGGEDDSVGERAGDVPADIDQPEEQDSKYGILNEDDSGGDRDQWESNLMTKEDEDDEAFSSMLGGDSNTGEAGMEGGPSSSGQGMAQEDDSAAGAALQWTSSSAAAASQAGGRLLTSNSANVGAYSPLQSNDDFKYNPSTTASALDRRYSSHEISSGVSIPASSTFSSSASKSESSFQNPRDSGGFSDAMGYDIGNLFELGAAGFNASSSSSTSDAFESSTMYGTGRRSLDPATTGSSCSSMSTVSNIFPGFPDIGISGTGEKGRNRFHCPVCPYTSLYSRNVRRHLLTHTGTRPFACPYCQFRSTTKHNVTLHVKSKHPDMVQPDMVQADEARLA